jgi:Bifunctional DNA primase/polymerase, N-terminal
MPTALEIALDYIRRGWAPIPVPHRAKKPIVDAWQNLRLTNESAFRYFNGEPQNIGVLLGGRSGGLGDVDLDCQEAIDVAGYFLKRTATFGRASKRESHWVYNTDLAETEDCAEIKFVNPVKGRPDEPAMLLELRIGGGGKGAQTVFPGSTHESGEAIAWENSEPVTELPGAVLKHQCAKIAVCALLARNMPSYPGRHDAALLLGGFFHRCGVALPDIKLMVEAIGVASRQPRDKIKDMIRTAEDAAKVAADGRKACGRTRLRQVFGEPVADKVCEWLGYREPDAAEDGDNRPEITFYAATPHRTADAAEEAIINAGFPVMHRGGALVMPNVESM